MPPSRHWLKICVGLLTLILLSVFTVPAHAESRLPHQHEWITIVNTPDSSGVNLRTGPSLSSDVIGKIPEGSTDQDYLCYNFGDMVGNPGTNLWFKVKYGELVGYYSSYYDTVDPHRQQPLDLGMDYGLWGCDKSLNSTYNRQVAVQWALDHAMDTSSWPQDKFTATCTYFVSQALRAGNFTETDEWHLGGSYGIPFVKTTRGTPAATSAPLLIDYLVRKYIGEVEWLRVGTLRDQLFSVPQAEPGDIIAYQWHYPRGHNSTDLQALNYTRFVPDHLSFVTGYVEGSDHELLVSEWGTATRNTDHVSYQQRYWTYSQNNTGWLQLESDNDKIDQQIEVYLLHFKI